MSKNSSPISMNPVAPLVLEAEGWEDYRLLDSGEGQKLEEVGGFRFIRPDAGAVWERSLPQEAWEEHHGMFVSSASSDEGEGGKWKLDSSLPPSWEMRYDGLSFSAMPTPFRHYGFFPEQAPHWHWCAERISDYRTKTKTAPRILNLFGYTGVASLHASMAGAEVVHVDSSKKAIAQAFANRDLSSLTDSPIRFITEDARRFVEREARRKRSYHGIILDPPKYGRGPKGEVWQWHRDLAPLLALLCDILSEDALFVVLTSYAIRSSFLSLHHALEATLTAQRGGSVSSGELAIREENERKFRLGQAIFARWSAGTHKD